MRVLHFIPLLLVGCTSLPAMNAPKLPFKPAPSVAKQRSERKADVLQSFEERRSQAEMTAALARWKTGDEEGCEQLLLSVLRRNASHVEARRQLAALYLDRDEPERAEPHLRRLLKDHPDDAQAHFDLALVLETARHFDEAAEHFEKATALEPESDIFQEGLASFRATRPSDEPARPVRLASATAEIPVARKRPSQPMLLPKLRR